MDTNCIDRFLSEYAKLPEWKKREPVSVASLLIRHGILETDYYLALYPDVLECEKDPALHYLRFGFREARSPGSWCGEKEIQAIRQKEPAIFELAFPEFIDKLRSAAS